MLTLLLLLLEIAGGQPTLLPEIAVIFDTIFVQVLPNQFEPELLARLEA